MGEGWRGSAGRGGDKVLGMDSYGPGEMGSTWTLETCRKDLTTNPPSSWCLSLPESDPQLAPLLDLAFGPRPRCHRPFFCGASSWGSVAKSGSGRLKELAVTLARPQSRDRSGGPRSCDVRDALSASSPARGTPRSSHEPAEGLRRGLSRWAVGRWSKEDLWVPFEVGVRFVGDSGGAERTSMVETDEVRKGLRDELEEPFLGRRWEAEIEEGDVGEGGRRCAVVGGLRGGVGTALSRFLNRLKPIVADSSCKADEKEVRRQEREKKKKKKAGIMMEGSTASFPLALGPRRSCAQRDCTHALRSQTQSKKHPRQRPFATDGVERLWRVSLVGRSFEADGWSRNPAVFARVETGGRSSGELRRVLCTGRESQGRLEMTRKRLS